MSVIYSLVFCFVALYMHDPLIAKDQGQQQYEQLTKEQWHAKIKSLIEHGKAKQKKLSEGQHSTDHTVHDNAHTRNKAEMQKGLKQHL